MTLTLTKPRLFYEVWETSRTLIYIKHPTIDDVSNWSEQEDETKQNHWSNGENQLEITNQYICFFFFSRPQ